MALSLADDLFDGPPAPQELFVGPEEFVGPPEPERKPEKVSKGRSALGSFVRSATQTAISGAVGAARVITQNIDELFPEGGTLTEANKRFGLPTKSDITTLEKGADAVTKTVNDLFPTDPETEQGFLLGQLPAGAGSLLGFVGAGALGRASGFSATAVSSAVGSLVTGEQLFERARQAGRTDDEAWKAFLGGAAVGSTEGLPVGKAFQRLDEVSGGAVRRLLARASAGFLEEGIQEFGQTIGENAVSQAFIDKHLDLFKLLDGAGEALAAGGILGAAMNAILGSPRFNRVKVGTGEQGATFQRPTEAATPADEVGQGLGTVDQERAINAPRSLTSIPVLSEHSTPLIQVMENHPTESGQELATRGQKAIDNHKKIAAQLQPEIDDYLTKISGRSISQHKDFQALNEIIRDGDVGETMFQRAVENDEVLDTLTPSQQEVVRSFRKVQRHVADIAQEMGVKIQVGIEPVLEESPPGSGNFVDTGKTQPKMIPFTGEAEGRRLSRTMTPEGWEIIEQGPGGELWDTLVSELARINDIDGEVALNTVNAMREQALTRRTSVEVARTLKRFPTHLFNGISVVPILNADPVAAAGAVLTHQAARLGFIAEFGQDQEKVAALVQRSMEKGGRAEAEDAQNLMRALQAIPVDKPRRFFRPGTIGYEASRYGRFLVGLMKSGLLTLSFVPNTFETVYTVPSTSGGRRYLRGLATMLSIGSEGQKAMLQETERNLSRTVEILNWNFNQDRAIESVNRIASNAGVFLGRKVNEFNEAVNAAAAIYMVRDLKAGKGTISDRMRLEFLRFKPGQVDQLMDGTASDDLYNAVAQRVAETGQGTTSVPAERSRLANNRTWNAFIGFDSYFQKTINRTLRLADEAVKAGKQWALDPSPENLEKLAIAGKRSGQWWLGAAFAGVGSVLLRAFVSGGVWGLREKEDELEGELGKFALESLKYSLLSGAGDIVSRSFDKRNPLGSAADNTLPGRLLQELNQFLRADGPYRNLGLADRVSKAQDRNVPATRAFRSWMYAGAKFLERVAPGFAGPRAVAAVLALGGQDPEFEAANRRYWAWRRKNTGVGFYEEEEPEAGLNEQQKRQAKFRENMKRAHARLIVGDIPEAEKAIERALDLGKSGKDVASSLRGMRMIQHIPPDMRDKFFEDVSPEFTQKIVEHDKLLDEWAKRFLAK